jgi:peptidoglycan/LPS O-acetylase OafA/YrhL
VPDLSLGSRLWARRSPLAGFAILGKISYGLYVFHMLAIHLCVRSWGGAVHNLRAFLGFWCLSLLLTFAQGGAFVPLLRVSLLRLKQPFTRVESRPG